jgi:hypothetical protein
VAEGRDAETFGLKPTFYVAHRGVGGECEGDPQLGESLGGGGVGANVMGASAIGGLLVG